MLLEVQSLIDRFSTTLLEIPLCNRVKNTYVYCHKIFILLPVVCFIVSIAAVDMFRLMYGTANTTLLINLFCASLASNQLCQ